MSRVSEASECVRCVDSREIEWHDWALFLKQFFGSMSGISKMHRFRFENEGGPFTASEYDEGWAATMSTLRAGVTADALRDPSGAQFQLLETFKCVPKPLQSDRRKYLIEKVVPHIDPTRREDFVTDLGAAAADDGPVVAAVEEQKEAGEDGQVPETAEEQETPRRGRGRPRGSTGRPRGRGGRGGHSGEGRRKRGRSSN